MDNFAFFFTIDRLQEEIWTWDLTDAFGMLNKDCLKPDGLRDRALSVGREAALCNFIAWANGKTSSYSCSDVPPDGSCASQEHLNIAPAAPWLSGNVAETWSRRAKVAVCCYSWCILGCPSHVTSPSRLCRSRVREFLVNSVSHDFPFNSILFV
jgi:hypothetical protein